MPFILLPVGYVIGQLFRIMYILFHAAIIYYQSHTEKGVDPKYFQ